MTVEAIPKEEHKEPRQLIQGGIKGGKNKPQGDQANNISPAKIDKSIQNPILEKKQK